MINREADIPVYQGKVSSPFEAVPHWNAVGRNRNIKGFPFTLAVSNGNMLLGIALLTKAYESVDNVLGFQ